MKYLSWYCTIVHIKLLDNILSKLETIKTKSYHLSYFHLSRICDAEARSWRCRCVQVLLQLATLKMGKFCEKEKRVSG